MAVADRDVKMGNYHYSSPDLSSPPSDSPSDPGSPSRHGQQRTSLSARNDEIVVNSSAASHFSLLQQPAAQPSGPLQPFAVDGVRLTKDGVPRKKPGRKPGPAVKKVGDGPGAPGPGTEESAAAAESGPDAPKPKRPRKPKDPNAPPVPRKKRVQAAPAAATGAAAPGLPRSSSASLHFEPKVELTSMRMDIDSRPPPLSSLGPSAILSAHQQAPRQPPLSMVDKVPKRESHPGSMQSILNADDSPPRPQPAAAPTSTTPVRSFGRGYDPVRSSTYDPVRETMLARDPYGTGPLGSPRAPTQMINRASASPSIASLVDPAPAPSLSRSPVGSSLVAHQVSPPSMSIAVATASSSNVPLSRYHENVPSLPPSPSPAPAIRNMISASASNPPAAAAAKTASRKHSPQAAAHLKSLSSTTQPATAASKGTAAAKSSAAKASARSDATGQTKASSRPAPPSSSSAAGSTTAKTTATKATSTKAAEKKAAAAAAKAAAAATAAGTTSAAAPDASKPASAKEPTASATSAPAPATSAPHIKKFSSILQQERGTKQNKAAASATSSPKLSGTKSDGPPSVAALDSALPSAAAGGETERSILDFGKALPGEEHSAPSIVLHIPLARGESNKYVNFMRMAEERYGWDALHPRLAAHRDRKLRIAAASAALERNGSGRESGDEMTDDMQSGDEGSNEENGAAGENGTNGVHASSPEDAPVKPVRKKRIFKEDEYDKDDDFVDDSEMLWEEQAAASRDGFFVYSGPLIPEEEKPAEGATTPAKRGRGTRGGRAKATTARTAVSRTTGGAGSRGGTTARRPRVTKQEKEQREREKAEQERASAKASANGTSLAGAGTPFSAGMAIDV